MFRTLLAMLVIATLAGVTSANAAVVIGGTRVVFPADVRDVSLRIENKGSDPALVQVWIDDGDERSTPSNARAPFAITPPVFRIDQGQGHALRIVHAGEEPPRERETLYWLNVLEIPPKAAEAEGKNVLQLAFRHRLKVFHRPKDLSMPVERAPSSLRWSVVRADGKARLHVENPSPYHVSFHAIELQRREEGGKPLSLGGGMVKPQRSAEFPLPDDTQGFQAATVSFMSINDFGGVVAGTSVIDP